jgi:hypothetical protein
MDIADMHTSGRAIMRIIERDIRMAGFEYRDTDAKVTYGTISNPLTIKDSGNKCCDEVTVIYDYFDEESKKAERIRIRYWAEPHKGSRHRLYKQKDILGRNKKILAKPILGTKDVMADYIEDLQFIKKQSNGQLATDSSNLACKDQAKMDLFKILDAQKTFFKNNGFYWTSNVIEGGTGGTCGNVKKWAYKNGIQQYPISWNNRYRVSYDRCSYGKYESDRLNKHLTKSDPIDQHELNPKNQPGKHVASSFYNVMGTWNDRNSWENGKFKPKGFRAYAWPQMCPGIPKNNRRVFGYDWLLWIDDKGNTGIGVGSMARSGRQNNRRSFTRTTNWSKPNSVSVGFSLVEINLTLRTKNQYGKDRQFKKKDYHPGNYKLDKTDKYKRDTFSSTVLVRNLAL